MATERTGRAALPTGIQTFAEIRAGGYRYVDKTPFALLAARDDKHLFLSRPRRFGKSLFVDTLKELYEGRERLFRGLAAHGRWDWSARRPVLRLSFARGDYLESGLLHDITMAQLNAKARVAEADIPHNRAPNFLYCLIEELHRRSGRRVVVLVDEYDKPILDALGDGRAADANRRFLRGLYGAVKDCDAHIEKSFVTGIAKFAKASLFSTANQFTDVSLDPRYNAVCGFTDAELDATFARELPGLDRDELRRCYDGYAWGDAEETVCNPYEMLRVLGSREIESHWFETGTPDHLAQLVAERGLAAVGGLDGSWVDRERLSDFDVGAADPAALLFQSGYLTIRERRRAGMSSAYRMEYPNEEVRENLGRLLARSALRDRRQAKTLGALLRAAVEGGDEAGLEAALRSLYAGMAHQQTRHAGRHEGLYAVLAKAVADSAGVRAEAEESSARGDADLVLRGGGNVFVLEFKTAAGGRADARAEEAWNQALEKGCALKYAAQYGERAVVAGVVVDPAERNIVRFRAGRPFAAQRR